MERNEQQELLEELMILSTIVNENPYGMSRKLLGALKEVAHSFIGKACIEGASREQVARYLGRDVRTLTRWKEQYDDFPEAHHNGHKKVTYDWMDVVKWKMRHPEVVAKK